MDSKEFDDKLITALNMGKSSNSKKEPFLTVNKLGEYLVASPVKQRSILWNLKYPKEEGGGWSHIHVEVRNSIKKFFQDQFDEEHLRKCIKKIEKREGTSNQKRADPSSLILLQGLLNQDFLQFDSFTYEPFTDKNVDKMHIEGVTVSVYPDLVLRSTSRGKDNIGLMTLHLGTTSELDIEGGKYIATVLHRFAEEYLKSGDEHVRPDHCISYDVFSGRFIECPKSITNRWKNIEAACKTIHGIWNSI